MLHQSQQRKPSGKGSTPKPAPQPTSKPKQISISDVLPELLDVPGLSQEFLTNYLRKKKLNPDIQTVNQYFDVSPINRQGLKEFLNLYTEYRSPKTISYGAAVFNALKTGMEYAKKTITNNEELDSETLQRIVKEVIEKINAANSFKDYCDLIPFCRVKAEEAQGKKTLGKNSCLWATLHALAGLIIAELTEKCIGFNLKIAALNEMVLQKQRQISISNNEKYGEDTKELNKELKDLYLILALFGDVNAINEALERGLLPHLQVLQGAEFCSSSFKVNKATPCCLQLNFYDHLYANLYQKKITHKEFPRFWHDAMVTGYAEAAKEHFSREAERREEDKFRTVYDTSKKSRIPENSYLSLSPTTLFVPVDVQEDYVPQDTVKNSFSEEEEEDEREMVEDMVSNKEEALDIQPASPSKKSPLTIPGIGKFASLTTGDEEPEATLTAKEDEDNSLKL